MAKKKEKKGLVIFVAIATTISLAGLTGIFGTSVPASNNTQQNMPVNHAQVASVTGVPCLTSEVFHLHPHLTITIDGISEPLPADIGVLTGCIQELHTHEEDGIIHVESDVDKGYTLADFLNVWGIGLEQPGYITRLTVDDEFNENDMNFKLEDEQEILLEFIEIPSFGTDIPQ